MRHASGLFIGLAFAAAALAQMTPPRTYGSPSGFGNILFPGMGSAPPIMAGRPGAGAAFGGRGYGRGGYPGGSRGYSPGYRGGGARTLVVPYAYPVFVGGGDNGYAEGSAPPEGYAQAPQQQAPTVIINQTFVPETAKPLMRDYMESDLPPARTPRRNSEPEYVPRDIAPDGYQAPRENAAAKATVYLIAFRDHSIYSAIAYWVEEDTLNYVTPNGVHNRASMDLVDQDLSRNINGERGIDFDLHKRKVQ